MGAKERCWSSTLNTPAEPSATREQFRQLPFLAKELLAGGAAGGLAKTCVAPLERVKILFQTGRVHTNSISGTIAHIYSSEGFLGLFRGNGASVLRIVPYSAFHFGAYEHYRAALVHVAGYDEPVPAPAPTQSAGHHHHTDPDGHPVQPPPTHHSVPPVLDLLAGSAAGATAVLLTYPLDYARTRLAYEVRDQGTSGQLTPASTSGSQPSTPSPRAHKPSSNRFANALHTGAGSMQPLPLQHHWHASSSAGPASASSMLAQNACQQQLRAGLGAHERWPNVRSRLQQLHAVSAQQLTAASHRLAHSTARASQGMAALPASSISGVLVGTCRSEGLRGVYRGIGPTLAGILPYAGLKFYVYQSLKQQYRSVEGHEAKRLPIPIMLTFGAGAGLVAQTATYPLDVVRRQMQRGGVNSIFRGLSLNYIKVVPSTAIGFTIYDALKQYLALPQNL